MNVNKYNEEYYKICTKIELIKSILGNYINGSLKNINLNTIEFDINVCTMQFNNLLSKQNKALIKNDTNTFIC